MDEADRLLVCAFGNEVFGLFRSWYNERTLNPDSVLARLTLVIAYATEAHLFITDVNQSPFNVGTRLTLSDFDTTQIHELNRRYQSPLPDSAFSALQKVTGGQPYLTRRVFDQVAKGLSLARVLEEAGNEDGLFGDHLRGLWLSVSRAPKLLHALRALTLQKTPAAPDDFYRLRAAGILTGSTASRAGFRCGLYENFFARQFEQTQ